MSSFNKRMNTNRIKWIICFILIAMLSVAVVFAFVKIDRNETTKTLGSGSSTYAVGLLDDSGAYKQGTSSIYMKDFASADGLTVEIEEDATVKYKVFFYDADKTFIEKTADLSEDYDGSAIPSTAKYFKIMITPTNDAEVSWTEIRTYASQLTVTVNK